jgi:hypothetical protein
VSLSCDEAVQPAVSPVVHSHPHRWLASLAAGYQTDHSKASRAGPSRLDSSFPPGKFGSCLDAVIPFLSRRLPGLGTLWIQGASKARGCLPRLVVVVVVVVRC